MSEFLVVLLLPAALLAAAGWDLASYTIPNFIPIGLVAAFVAFTLAAGLSVGVVETHVLAGVLALALGFALFAAGFAGGGDAKFFAAVCLWLGVPDLLQYAVAASLFGGGLTVGLLMFRSLPIPAALLNHEWICRLHDRKSGVPYGVALAAGAFVLLPYTEIFHASLHG